MLVSTAPINNPSLNKNIKYSLLSGKTSHFNFYIIVIKKLFGFTNFHLSPELKLIVDKSSGTDTGK